MDTGTSNELAAAAPAPTLEPRQKIDDAGEFVPYARKHLQAESGPITQDSITLEQLWPEPDWEKLIKAGMQIDVAAAIAMMRDGLSTKPRAASGEISRSDWANAYIKAVLVIQEVLMASKTPKEAFDLSKRMANFLGINLATVGKEPARKNLVFWAAGRGVTRFYAPGRKTLRQQELARWLPKLGWPADKSAMAASVVPVKLNNGTWRATKIDGNHYVTLDARTYPTESEAIAAVLEHARQVQTGEKIPTRPSPTGDARRNGEDFREGRDIMPEDLMREFGLRAVQFGNSLSQRQRQEWMNHAYDALCDLAAVIEWPRLWIGFKTMALAIGARGKGGAAAHFEPSFFTINMTLKNGAGSFAHEWWHAMDCRMAKSAGTGGDSIALFVNKWGRCNHSEFVKESYQKVMPKLQDLVLDFMRRDGRYFQQSSRVTSVRRAGSYWTSVEEMFARSFEAFVQDSLAARGLASPWLVHGTLESDYDLSVVAACPYPTGEERTRLNQKYRDLLKQLANPKA